MLEEKKETILEEAARLVNGPRLQEYGHPKESFQDIADVWNILLSGKIGNDKIGPHDVIKCMMALKLCRTKQSGGRDNFVDLAGYAQCWELVNE